MGDSKVNVSNSGQSSHRAKRHWLNVHANGHFAMGFASNQGIGGAVLTQTADPTKYIGLRKAFWLNQISDGSRGVPRTCVSLDICTNDGILSTFAEEQATYLARIQEVLDAGGVVFLPAVCRTPNNQTAGAQITRWQQRNDWLATLHSPANRIFALMSRKDAYPNTTTTYLYDGLHDTGLAAYLIGQCDAADLAPYLGAGNVLDAATALPATTIAPGTGASGLIPTGLTLNCTTTGASGGTAIGVTAVCTMVTDERGEPLLRVSIQGTASAVGRVIAGKTFNGVNAIYGDLFEAFCDVRLRSSATADPVGASVISNNFGTLGGMFASTVDANAGDVQRGFAKAIRTVPSFALASANNITAELFNVGIKAGTVDIVLEIGRNGYRQVDTVAYALPFNAAAAMPAGLTNPIGDRPRLNGTGTVGQTVTLQPGGFSGGGFRTAAGGSMSFSAKRGGTAVVTKVPGDVGMTYLIQAGDAGATLVPEHTATNVLGSSTSTGAGLAVAA